MMKPENLHKIKSQKSAINNQTGKGKEKMRKLIAICLQHIIQKKHPDWKIIIQKAQTGTFYIMRKNKTRYKKIARIANHPRLTHHKKPIIKPTQWTIKRPLGFYVETRKYL